VPRLVLLGTGMPFPDPVRRGPATVVEDAGALILIDCGASALHRFIEAKLDPKRLQAVALTHLHSDHITGIADLLWAGAIYRWWPTPPPFIGPPGTRQFLERLVDAFSVDTATRALDRSRVLPEVTEVVDGWAQTKGPFRLSAFRVEHGRVEHAFGYRIDLERGSIALSGDTSKCENLIRKAAGVDVLVHEVINRAGMEQRIAQTVDEHLRTRQSAMLASHTPADELGEIATRAGTGHLVLSHINAIARPEDELVSAAQRGYDGKVTLGQDLMSLEF
jgi:ribonuclease Z